MNTTLVVLSILASSLITTVPDQPMQNQVPGLSSGLRSSYLIKKPFKKSYWLIEKEP